LSKAELTLVEGGKVRTQRLKKELITMAQLEAAARKQGFESLSEVDQCVLEPVARLLLWQRSGHRRRSPPGIACQAGTPHAGNCHPAGLAASCTRLIQCRKKPVAASAIPVAPMSTPPIQKIFSCQQA